MNEGAVFVPAKPALSLQQRLSHQAVWLLGLASFFMFPVVGDIKPFDLIAVAVFLLKARDGFEPKKHDLLFIVFLAFAFASLASARLVADASLLQTVRYAVFFALARLAFSDSERAALVRGLKWSMMLNFAWIVLDLVQYYTVGDCVSLNVSMFPWVVHIGTHRYPIDFMGCPILRPTGFTWDPGGLFPILLVTAYALRQRLALFLGALFSVVAVSRTAILTAAGLFVGRRFPVLAWVGVLLAVLVIPFFALVYAEELLVNFEDGTLRHLTYPGLAVLGVIDNPRYLLLGDGLRGGATMFLTLDHAFLSGFFSMDDLLSGAARNLVIESIWVNQLTGAGVIGMCAFLAWLAVGFKDNQAALIGLLVAGTYYTFDSSLFCFIVPFLMTVCRPDDKPVPAAPSVK